MAWEPPDVDTDPDSVAADIISNMEDRMPGWAPVEGAPEVVLAGEMGRETAATNLRTTTALAIDFAGLGQTVYGVAPRQGTAAVLPDVEITFNPVRPGPSGLADATIPAGFTIVVDELAYQLLEAVTPTTTDPLHISMQAVDVGAAGNLQVDDPVDAEITTATLAVVSAQVLASGVGGEDEETLDDYLARLIDYVSLLRPGGVLGTDLAAFARTVAGVERAIGIDLFDPDVPGDHERTATVIAIDQLGQPVISSELEAALEGIREVNFVIHLGEPTYTPVDVAVDVDAEPDQDPVAVKAAVKAAVEELIDPARWGSTDDDPRAWVERTSLRLFDVAEVVFDVDGVASIVTITLNGGTSTLTLDGPGALPAPLDDPSDPSTVVVT